MAIVAFIVVLVVLILVHEMGHFLTAKWMGVKVLEFGLGFPPKMVAVNWRGTQYSLNWLPLGGFVRLLGEEDPKETDSLAQKSIPIRLLVLSSGSLMNILLPVVLFTLTFMIPHPVPVEPVTIDMVAPGSPAERVGLKSGDVILELNGRPIRNRQELIYNIHLNLGEEINLLTERDGSRGLVRVTPRWAPPRDEGPLGIRVGSVQSLSFVRESLPFWEAIPLGMRSLGETFKLFRNEIAKWFVGRTAPQVAGPIGIAQATGDVARAGVSPLLAFAAFISINLAIVNLLPIPGLDGGRLLFVFLEAIRRGKRISPQRERLVHLIGFALLIGFIIFVSYFDILRLAGGG